MTTTDSAATTSTDPRPAFARAVDLLVEVAAGIDADQLSQPTPCTGMDVRQLLDHVAMAVGRAEAAALRTPLEQWPAEGASAGDDWAVHLRQAGDAAIAAWASADDRLAEQVQLPWATLTGTETVGIYLNELQVHTWDLARATGQSPAWDDDVVAAAEVYIREQLPMAERAPMWEEAKAQLPPEIPWAAPFADAVPVPDDAPAIDRLVAWNGRDPQL